MEQVGITERNRNAAARAPVDGSLPKPPSQERLQVIFMDGTDPTSRTDHVSVRGDRRAPADPIVGARRVQCTTDVARTSPPPTLRSSESFERGPFVPEQNLDRGSPGRPSQKWGPNGFREVAPWRGVCDVTLVRYEESTVTRERG